MPYSEFYCDPVSGNNLYAGSTTGAPLVTYTSGNWVNATRVFTVASGNPVTDGVTVGMFVSVYADGSSAPTGFVGRVTAVSSTTITVSSSASSGTNPTDGTGNRTLVVGGAWLGPNGASGFPMSFVTNALKDASSNPARVNYKNSATYSITANITVGSSQSGVTHQGYSSSAGDLGKATIDGGTSGASYSLVTNSGAPGVFVDLVFSHNGATGSTGGFQVSNGTWFERCVFRDMAGPGVTISSGAHFIECEAYNNNTNNTANRGGFHMDAAWSVNFVRCVAHDNAGSNTSGFFLASATSSAVYLEECVADTNGAHGFFNNSGTAQAYFRRCVAYNNTGDGIRHSGTQANYFIESCLLESNGGYGINQSGTPTGANFPQRVLNCAFFGNTSGQTNGINSSFVSDTITLSASGMASPSTGNFAPAAAALSGAGRGKFTQSVGYTATTTSFPDVGAVQASGGQASAAFLGSLNLGRREYRSQVTRRLYTQVPGNVTATTVYVPLRIDQPRVRGRAATTHRRMPPALVPLPAAINNYYIPVVIQRTRHSTRPSRPPQLRYLPVVVTQQVATPIASPPRQSTRVVRTVRREPVVVIVPPPQTVIVHHPRVVR